MSFLTDDTRSVSQAGLGGTAGVPLFYKEPYQKTGIIQDQPVQLTDIVPTITAELELEPPWPLDGRDIFAADPSAVRSIIGDEKVDVPEDLTAMIEATAAEMHEVFGDGTSGSLYALGGARDLIGTQAARWETGPSGHCWTSEQLGPTPGSIIEFVSSHRPGTLGYVFGRIESAIDPPIAFAISVDGIVAGTARSYMDGLIHRVYAIGDMRFWHRNSEPIVELHEIIDGRLAPIPFCSPS